MALRTLIFPFAYGSSTVYLGEEGIQKDLKKMSPERITP